MENMDLILKALDEMGKTDCDAYMFIPADPQATQMNLQQLKYHEQGIPEMGGMGNVYHIILYDVQATVDAKGKRGDAVLKNKEMFEAVLVHPATYIKRMIKDGWFGVVAKKTTTSYKLVDALMGTTPLTPDAVCDDVVGE